MILGRGEHRSARIEEVDGVVTLVTTIPDPRMSARHVRLSRLAAGWVAADCASKNGTRLAGARIERSLMAPGAPLEIGDSTLLIATSRAGADHAFSSPLAPGAQVTLLPDLEAELERLAAIAGSRVPVLVLGETGTGKELVAREVHARSGRRGRFLAVNCGALPPTLVHAELFGARKGAFSGATEDRQGLFRAADGGTLFLDEIGDLDAPAQVALLRVLQEGEVLPLGSTTPVSVDVRIVAATHRDLEERVFQGHFRADLLARLEGHLVRLPPLRERAADLGVLTAALLHRLAPQRAAGIRLAPEAARLLFAHDWPNNVRELEQALTAALPLLGEEGVVTADVLPERIRSGRARAPTRRASPLSPADEELRARLDQLIRDHEGNLAAVARALGKDRTQIRRWIARLEIDTSLVRGGRS